MDIDGVEYLNRYDIKARFNLSIDQINYLRKLGKLGDGYKFDRDKRAYWKTVEVEAALQSRPLDRALLPKENRENDLVALAVFQP